MTSRALVIVLAITFVSACSAGHDRDAWCGQMKIVAERGAELLNEPTSDDPSFDRALLAYNTALGNLVAMEPPEQIADDLQIALDPLGSDDETFAAAGNRVFDFIDEACPGVPDDYLEENRAG